MILGGLLALGLWLPLMFAFGAIKGSRSVVDRLRNRLAASLAEREERMAAEVSTGPETAYYGVQDVKSTETTREEPGGPYAPRQAQERGRFAHPGTLLGGTGVATAYFAANDLTVVFESIISAVLGQPWDAARAVHSGGRVLTGIAMVAGGAWLMALADLPRLIRSKLEGE